MSDENDFFERPLKKVQRPLDPNSLAGRLRQTAENGQAIRLPARYSAGVRTHLRKMGYKLVTRMHDGNHYGWCEKIEAEP